MQFDYSNESYDSYELIRIRLMRCSYTTRTSRTTRTIYLTNSLFNEIKFHHLNESCDSYEVTSPLFKLPRHLKIMNKLLSLPGHKSVFDIRKFEIAQLLRFT